MKPSDQTWMIAALVALAACHSPSASDHAGVPTNPNAVAPTTAASVELALYGRTTPSPVPGSCARGLFFSTRVRNLSSQPLPLYSLAVTFEPLGGRCARHEAPIDPRLERVVAPGGDEEVRVFDGAGTLCAAPNGQPGCTWHATATVSSDAGPIAGTLDFSSSAGYSSRPDCARAVPRITDPADGDTVSGTVVVWTTPVEGGGCVHSARTIISAYSSTGVIVGRSLELDLGDPWRWNTSRLPSGRYHLRTEQNCCGILSDGIQVTVQN